MSNEQQTAENTAPAQPTERQWEQAQYARALKYCSEKGLRMPQMDRRNSRVLPPYIALWLVSSQDLTDKLWVLTGDLPADHVSVKVAGSARDALRHFSLAWQLKSQGLFDELQAGRASLGNADNQHAYARMLVSRAESMYGMAEDESLWAKA